MAKENNKLYIPDEFLEYISRIHLDLQFHFKVTRRRLTKAGDYRYNPRTGSHTITINENLNQWAFLVTYLHEVAHMKVQLNYGSGLKHHGEEWKAEFRKLLLPVISSGHVPDNLVGALAAYARNPKASSWSDPRLARALQEFDEYGGTQLYDLDHGVSFRFKGQSYTMMEKRRTRALCMHELSQRRYLISMAAVVEIENN
ncbi:MAG: SprT-like domain-containing protein [Cyclobacteriaceae bacterium]|nr:SprT-like domain-containing protein [Cyclobacteriaceae bacterium]